MLDFKDRLKEEYKQLIYRHTKLLEFIDLLIEENFIDDPSDKIPSNLRILDQNKRGEYLSLMNKQGYYMKEYLNTLKNRMDLLGINILDDDKGIFEREYYNLFK